MRKPRNLRERLEAYILERTVDHPSVEAIVMFENGGLCFRLADRSRQLYGKWSSWFDKDGLAGGPDMLQLDHEIIVRLKELEDAWG